MEQQKTTIQTKPEEDRILWLGMILIIVGTVSFSSYEIVGNMLTLVGGVIVVGNCIWSRRNITQLGKNRSDGLGFTSSRSSAA